MAGLCGGVCQYTARSALKEVTNALLCQRREYIFMPTLSDVDETSQRNLERFKLPQFALAVEGIMNRFQEALRRILQTKTSNYFGVKNNSIQ